ncbi:MAG TPA: RsiV family protein [Clostridia bacterium]|nr:RsiV family protein [Clostridia bacterium]
MNRFDVARKKYEATEIPEELQTVVRTAIGAARKGTKIEMKRMYFWPRVAACALALFLTGNVAALNLSPTFAAYAAGLPVVGPVAKVLTLREYTVHGENADIAVSQPAVNAEGDFAKEINALIEQEIGEYTARAEKDIAEYKEAFLATGGTENEFKEKNIKVDVSYELKSQSESMVSFVLTANENWCSALGVQYFYNLNLTDGKTIALADLLGEGYAGIARRQIEKQMEERKAADSNIAYFGEPEVNGNTAFYINAKGNPVVVFPKYELAPGAMGPQEFELTK